MAAATGAATEVADAAGDISPESDFPDGRAAVLLITVRRIISEGVPV